MATASTSTKIMEITKTRSMTPEQCRAARVWLGWSQTELAGRANISLSTVRDFETGRRTPTANNLAAMRRTIEAAGIRPVFNKDGGAAGILRHGGDLDLSGDAG
jgi:DNA-binding transcriptional regulator YiaG